jgi:hypothetical protein
MIVGLMLTFPLARIIFFDIENVLDNFLLVNLPSGSTDPTHIKDLKSRCGFLVFIFSAVGHRTRRINLQSFSAGVVLVGKCGSNNGTEIARLHQRSGGTLKQYARLEGGTRER